MAGSVNKAILIGRLGSDPDVRTLQNGKEMCTFSLATSESWKDKETGEKKDRTEWHRVSCFNEGLVGVIKNYVKKGSRVYVEGTIRTNKFTDKEGVEKYSTQVVLEGFTGRLDMLDSKNDSDSIPDEPKEIAESENISSNTSSTGDDKEKKSSSSNDDLDDEIPF